MKTIIVYSGKGGVGKTTISILYARYLSEIKNSKVLLIDGDFNTPSIKNIDRSKLSKNLDIFSVEENSILSKLFIKKMITAIKNVSEKEKYDYVIIDTPPSITEIHESIFANFEISGILYVTQPTKFSISDVKKTSDYLKGKGLLTIGLIINMFEEGLLSNDEIFSTLNIPIIGKINRNLKYWEQSIDNVKIPDFFENIDIDNLKNTAFKIYQNERIKNLLEDKRDYSNMKISSLHKYDRFGAVFTDEPVNITHDEYIKLNKKFFINFQQWEFTRNELLDEGYGYEQQDKFLELNDSETIKKIVTPFLNDTENYFMIWNPLPTAIKTLPCEIVKCTLDLDSETYYGVPKLKSYLADEQVTIFPHEVRFLPDDEIKNLIFDEKAYTKISESRYIPTLAMINEMIRYFGSRVFYNHQTLNNNHHDCEELNDTESYFNKTYNEIMRQEHKDERI